MVACQRDPDDVVDPAPGIAAAADDSTGGPVELCARPLSLLPRLLHRLRWSVMLPKAGVLALADLTGPLFHPTTPAAAVRGC